MRVEAEQKLSFVVVIMWVNTVTGGRVVNLGEVISALHVSYTHYILCRRAEARLALIREFSSLSLSQVNIRGEEQEKGAFGPRQTSST